LGLKEKFNYYINSFLFTCKRFGGWENLGSEAVPEGQLSEDGPEAVGSCWQLLLDRLVLGHVTGLAGPPSRGLTDCLQI